MTDDELESAIADVSNGDRDALRRVYDSCGHAVYSLALSLLHNSHSAEDAVQDTFLKIWCGAGSYRRGGRPMSWILAIAHNAAVDSVRKLSRETAPIDEELADSAVPVDRRTEERFTVGKALESLPDCDREIIVLRVIGGLGYREVCRILSLPPGTAAWKYARGIKKLRELLSEDA